MHSSFHLPGEFLFPLSSTKHKTEVSAMTVSVVRERIDSFNSLRTGS